MKYPSLHATGALLLLASLTAAGEAAAQPVDPPPSLPRHDAAVTIGWTAGDERRLGETYHDWYNTYLIQLQVGRYWTDHLKTQVAVGLTGEGSMISYESVSPPPVPPFYYAPIPIENRLRAQQVSIAQVYQFGRNEWLHPFIGAGVTVEWQRRRFEALGFPPGYPPGAPPTPAGGADSNFAVKFDLLAGLKFYATERAFVLTDLRIGMAERLDRVAWSAGVGFDF